MLRRAALLAALTALLVPAVAGTATADAAKKRKDRSPVVTKVAPTHVFVGEKLTIRGKNFRRGVNKNTVAFKRKGAKAVFVKADKGTAKLLSVTLPKRLEKVLVVQNGTPVPTRLQVRVLAKRFGKKYTRLSRSPVIGPEKPPAPPKPKAADPDADCDGDGQRNAVDADDDNDLLTDDVENSFKTDQCKADTDGDGAEDGYEYASARDLNDDEQTGVPYPRKLPYPNALDGTDGETDHDGDSLTLLDEYRLWKVSGVRSLAHLSYSAGEQYSVHTGGGPEERDPALSAVNYDKQLDFLAWANAAGYAQYRLADVGVLYGDQPNEWWEPRITRDIRDMDRNTVLHDAERYYYDDGNLLLHDGERDEDADGLSNFMESTGCMVRKLWDGLYTKETPYPLTYPGTALDDADSDGDGIRDGADDQDNDDVPNIMECSRSLAAHRGFDAMDAEDPQPNLPAAGFVNPYNPCLPHTLSRTCRQYVTVGKPWAPFVLNEAADYYFIWN
jgi:hypothetical protein